MKGVTGLFGRLVSAVTVMAMAVGLMLPATQAHAATVSKSFTTHSEASSPLQVFGGESFNFTVSGTFVGTVKLQRSFNGSDFKDLTPAVSTTGAYNVDHFTDDVAKGRRVYYRVYASTHTSGTIVTSMSDINDTVEVTKNLKGVDALVLKDDGLQVPGTLTVTGATSLTGALSLAAALQATATTVKVSSSATSNIPFALDGAYTTAQLQAKTPSAAGQLVFNVTLSEVCVSTGATVQGYARVKDAATCQ